jgi:DNA-binding transcriptional MerR regulator
MRVTALAREARLSVQQIRNYVDAGLLPTTERADNGYRIFTSRHADALTVARIMLDGYDWHTTATAMSAAHSGRPAVAVAAVDHCHAELDRERADVSRLLQALEGDLPDELQVRRPVPIREAAAVAGVRPSALRVWEGLGLLTPSRDPATGYRLYNQTQLIRARVTALLRGSGYSLAAAKEVMDAMRGGDPARTRTALRSRLRDLDRLSWKRMRATATFFAYLEGLGGPGP